MSNVSRVGARPTSTIGTTLKTLLKTLGRILVFLGAMCLVVTVVTSFTITGGYPGWLTPVEIASGPTLTVGILLWVFSSLPSTETGSDSAKNGPLVAGELLSVEGTGWRINDEPQVELTIRFHTLPRPLQDRQEITTTCKLTLPEHQLAGLDPGDLLLVHYNPDDPQDITVGTDADHDAQQQAFNQHRVAAGLMTQRALDISQNGVKTSGVVLQSFPTGAVVDGSAEIELQMRVTRPDGTLFDVTTVKVVENDLVPRTIPGNVLPVFYMPHDEQDIIVGFPMA